MKDARYQKKKKKKNTYICLTIAPSVSHIYIKFYSNSTANINFLYPHQSRSNCSPMGL